MLCKIQRVWLACLMVLKGVNCWPEFNLKNNNLQLTHVIKTHHFELYLSQIERMRNFQIPVSLPKNSPVQFFKHELRTTKLFWWYRKILSKMRTESKIYFIKNHPKRKYFVLSSNVETVHTQTCFDFLALPLIVKRWPKLSQKQVIELIVLRHFWNRPTVWESVLPELRLLSILRKLW